MDNDAAADTLSEISKLVFGREFGEARERARRLWASLSKNEDADPLLRGWARFYDFKCSYELCDYRAAFDLISSPPGVHFSMTATNVAWMYSVAAELAMHLGLAQEVVRFAQRCLELRQGESHRVARAQCLQTACVLLAELRRDDLNLPFSRELIDTSELAGIELQLLRGCRYLMAASETPAKQDQHRLIGVLPRLSQFSDDRVSAEAIECIAAIERAPWFEPSLSQGLRRRREHCAVMCELARRGDAGKLESVLASDPEVDPRDGCARSPLHHAAFAGHVAAVRVLLDAGAEVDAQNIQRRTPLVLAADQGYTHVAALLLDAGADPNLLGIADQTALHVACWQGHTDCVRLLLARGADVALVDATGNTALTLTATEPQPTVVEMLVRAGASVNQTTKLGHTPLMKAAMEGQSRVVEVLLALDADPSRRDCHGLSARDWAEREGHSPVVALLADAKRAKRENGHATLRLG